MKKNISSNWKRDFHCIQDFFYINPLTFFENRPHQIHKRFGEPFPGKSSLLPSRGRIDQTDKIERAGDI